MSNNIGIPRFTATVIDSLYSLVYILPEFCRHDIYYGWHLYERERADGPHRNQDGEWGWLRGPLSVQRVRNLCLRMGYGDMPAVTYEVGSGECQKFVDAFAERFPLGLRAWIDERHHYRPAPLTFDPHPDREIILKEQRLYLAWRDGIQYALLASDTDEAESIMRNRDLAELFTNG